MPHRDSATVALLGQQPLDTLEVFMDAMSTTNRSPTYKNTSGAYEQRGGEYKKVNGSQRAQSHGSGSFQAPNSLASVDLQQTDMGKEAKVPIETVYEEAVPQQAKVSQVNCGSFSTAAYREYLSTGNGSTHSSVVSSATSSAASSLAPSRQQSRAGSGFSSACVSGYASRADSPTGVRKELQGFAQPISYTAVPQQPVDFSKLNTRETSSDSDSDEDGYMPLRRSVMRPNHFTFSQDDIVKSFLKAAEKERQRAERDKARAEEAARIAAQQVQQAREEEERRARALAAQTQKQYRPEHVGYGWSPVAPSRKRLPIPAHFRFSSGDLSRSTSKPSQRQAIGHWTTFPKSSTIMFSAPQLKQIIVMKAEQFAAEQARAKAAAAQQRVQHKQSQQAVLKNAPASPAADAGALDRSTTMPRSTAQLTRVATHRRGSLPLMSHSLLDSLKSNAPLSRVAARSAGHVRSSSTQWPSKELDTVVASDKSRLQAQESSTTIRGGHVRLPSADSVMPPIKFEARRAVTLQPAKGVLLTTAGAMASATQQALDASARRSQVLHARSGSAAEMLSLSKSVQRSPSPSLLNGSHSSARKLLNGSESKSSSAHTSPVPPVKSLAAMTADMMLYDSKAFTNGTTSVNASLYTKPIAANGLYANVPSTGYGQRTATMGPSKPL